MKILKVALLIAVFTLAGAVFTHDLGSINQDIGRHLKLGEIIWQTKSVPKINLFSYTEPNTPFINHHWGSEVMFYLLNLAGGLKGLIVLKTIILLATLALLYFAVSSRTGPLAFTLATVSALVVIIDRTDVRPEIFSFLFLAYFLFAIFRAKYTYQYHWLYALPIVELVWTNMHIYFPLGIGLMGFFVIDRYINADPKWRHVAWICLASIAATLINPSGIHGVLEPFTVLGSYGYGIVENQGILFLKNYGILLTSINLFIFINVLFVLSFIPALKRYGIKGYFFETITAVVFTIFGADMIRNFGPYTIVLVPIFALNLQIYRESLTLSRKAIMTMYTALLILIGICISTVPSNAFNRWVGSDNKFGLTIPVGAQGGVDFVLQNHIQGLIFNNFDVGSYLIWKLYPQQQVFIDGRPEAYTPQFFSDIYEPMQEDPATWNHYANDVYHINYIFFDYHDITPWAQTFLSWIPQDSNWALVYQDGSTVIFLRRTTQNLPIIQKYEHPTILR